MKDNKIFDFSRVGFQQIINTMTRKINEVVEVANGLISRLDDYISKIDWDKIVNDELYQKVLGEVGKTSEELENIAIQLTPNGSDDSVNIKNAFINVLTSSTRTILFTKGNYNYRSLETINIPSNVNIKFEKEAVINVLNDMQLFKINNAENIYIENGKIIGTGTRSSNHTIYITESNNIHINGIEIDNSNATGINLINSKDCLIENCNIHHCSVLGISDKLGENNTIRNNITNYNGDGKEKNVIGRGILLWMCKNCKVLYNEAKYNTEYGIRLYSESADEFGMEGCIVDGNTLCDNGSVNNNTTCIDLYIFNASEKIKNCSLINNNIIRTTKFGTKENICIGVQGENILCENNTIVSDSYLEMSAIVFYKANKCKVSKNRVINFNIGCQTHGTSSECEIKDNIFYTKNGLGLIQGSLCLIQGNKFYHITDEATNAIDTTSSSYLRIINNYFNGFKRAIQIGDNPITITLNKSENCQTGLYKYGNLMDDIFIFNNEFDSAYPDEIVNFIGGNKGHNRRILTYPAAPSRLTWNKGDRVINNNPGGGKPKGWICTVSGTPGTWVSEGNL